MAGREKIVSHALAYGMDKDKNLACAVGTGIAEQTLAPVCIMGYRDTVQGNKTGEYGPGGIVHGSSGNGGIMVHDMPSMVMVVFGLSGTAFPEGTLEVVPSGKATSQVLSERFRIPAAPGIDGWETTRPIS